MLRNENPTPFSAWEELTPIRAFIIPTYWPAEIKAKENYESYANLLDSLSGAIAQMLQSDFPGLLQLLYQIDIPEALSQAIFELQDKRQIAECLAELLVRRELKKIETRKKYKQGLL